MSIGKNLSYIPQQKLIDYVKNPELAAAANIPAVSALFELQQRVVKDKELAALKAKEAMAQGPQSVADKTIAASQPQGLPAAMNLAQNNQPMNHSGVASLDTGDMYNEQNFAGGGIVAFDDGGDVGLKTRSRFDTLTNEEKQIIAAQYGVGADLGNQRGSIGAEYAGIVNQQGATVPRLSELRGRYMTDQGNEYNARYMPDARALSVDRNAGRSSVGADVAPGPDNRMGLRSIRGSYITDDGTRYGAGYNTDAHEALFEQIRNDNARLGLTVSPDKVGVQGQYNFAQGGEVKGFDGTTGSNVELLEKYKPEWLKNPTAALFPSEPVPTMDDIKMQQLAANQAYGVDPEYYKTRAAEAATSNKEELDSARRLSNANILFSMAEKLGTTPGPLLRGLVAAGPAGGKAAVEGMQNEAKIKQLQKLADDKLKDAQYAQARGDAQGALKSIEDYKKLRSEMGLKAAELETKIKEVGITADAAKAGKLSGLQNTARDNAMNEMKAAYPTGVNDTHFGGDTNKVTRYNTELEERYQNNLNILYKNAGVINPNATANSTKSTSNAPATNVAAPTGKPKPTQDDMKYVLENLNNPAVAAKYEETFGVKAPRSMADLIPQ